MSEGLLSKVIGKLARKFVPQASEAGVADDLNAVLVNYKIRPREKDIFATEGEVQAHVDGYSDTLLNEYIIAKSVRWLEALRADEFVLPPHVYSLLFVISLVQTRLDRPLRILDFGGGAPTIPILLRQMNAARRLAAYRIVESPTFVDKVPQQWKAGCEYASIYDGESCDLLILSSVLPYLDRALVHSIYRAIEKSPPQFIYFGRTSFLSAQYPAAEAFTVQESRFREHGAQVDVGMADIENNVARYVKRHFKWAEVAQVLDPLGYRRVLSMADDSGLENIKGLGLYSDNSLWERENDGR